MKNKFINELEAQKRTPSTIKNYNWVLGRLEKFKPLDSITKDDLIKYFKAFDAPDNTLALHYAIVKKYFRFAGKPEIVNWIKKLKPKETLHPNDILTTDDINKLVESTDSLYYKALIAFLFETGCRISEAKSLKYKDFKDTDQGMVVNIPTTKTTAGLRKVIIPFSSQYVRNLKLYSGASGNDIVFKIQLWQTNNMIRIIAKNAGITKPISAHKFRHAQATDLVKRGYNEAIIRKKLGWTPISGMIARYQHLNDEDVINATLEHAGKLPPTASPRIEMKEAERISLVDAAMQFSKLTEENEQLKTRLDEIEQQRKKDMALNEDMIKAMIETRVKEMLKNNTTV